MTKKQTTKPHIFPTLFQKTNTGAMQSWQIEADEVFEDGFGVITTTWGQLGGKQQVTTDVIRAGKNVGRSNETSVWEQTLLEAEAKWTKQLKKGYVKTLKEAEAGTVDAVIEGGIAPMLAPSKIYPHFASKLQWPVYVQGKIDGTRCVAVVEGGACTLWSRTRKRINSVPHINGALVEMFEHKAGRHIIDGELYNHDLRNEFEELISLIRQAEPKKGHEKVQYWVYDYPSVQGGFYARYEALAVDVQPPTTAIANTIILVPTNRAEDHDQVMLAHEENLAAGFEGSMVRNDGPYEHDKRSYHLQKLKNFIDSEYEIVGAEEGRGKDAGTVGAFVCHTEDGKEFRCRLKASYARRRELFGDPAQYMGKLLTVAYQNLTADGLPRFPIGKSIRDYE